MIHLLGDRFIDSPLRAVIDADALARIWIADILLTIAENTGLFSPTWTEQIIAETYRAQTQRFRRAWSEESSLHFLSEVKRSFPSAMIRGHERWLSQCTNHEGDRHVLACAIEAGAAVIVTYNIAHFKEVDLAPWNTRALSPDEFLLELYALDPLAVWKQVRAIKGQKRFDNESEVLERLRKHAPEFAARLLTEWC